MSVSKSKKVFCEEDKFSITKSTSTRSDVA